MDDEVVVRPLESLDDARAASELFDRIWQERRVMGAPLIRAMAAHGGQVLGAFIGDEMVGAQVGLVGIGEGGPTLHSHITGIALEAQHRGVGFRLKVAQREWCLERGIEVITWTFDPMVARNAYFNLEKLGAVADRFHRDYYGPMNDAFNRGDRSDRLEVRWELRSDRVRRALDGPTPRSDHSPHSSASFAVRDEGGRPEPSELGEAWEQAFVAFPPDYHALREADPEAATAWRDAVGDALESAFAAGARAIGFVRSAGYLLERR